MWRSRSQMEIGIHLKSPHKLIETGNCVREWAYQLQEKYDLELATPLTHSIKKETTETTA